MTLPIRTHAQANIDLLEARAWYDDELPGLGARFFDAVSAVVRALPDTPLAYPRVAGETRRARVRRFPYSVYFQVRSDHILVVAIMHNSRHPDRWRSRS